MSATEIRKVNSSNFETIILQNEIVFLDFWAEWCAPCKQFGRIFEKAALENKNIIFGQVNVETETDLAETFQIRSIPHLMVFKQGIAIYSESGSMPEATLKELIQQAIEADVSGIKEEIEKEDSE